MIKKYRLKHMRPLTPALPIKKETMVVTMVDKYCSIAETVKFKCKTDPIGSIFYAFHLHHSLWGFSKMNNASSNWAN